MKRKLRKLMMSIVVAVLFGGEMVWCFDKPESRFSWPNEFFDDQHFRSIDSPHSHWEIPTMTADGTNRVAGAGGVNSQKVEGSLDIFWENYLEPTATPTFKIHFLKYLNSINGAQQSKTIVGAANLVVYFMELGFTPEDANHWVAQVNEKKSVSIPNVMLASQHAIAYERPT